MELIQDFDFDFDLTEKSKHAGNYINLDEKLYTKYNKFLSISINNFNQICNKELIENEQIRIITTKTMNAITLIDCYSKIYKFTEIFIAIFRMNDFTANWIVNYATSNKDINIHIIFSSFIQFNNKYERWVNFLFHKSKEIANLTVTSIDIHAKIFIGKTQCGKHIVFEGSGNMSDNTRIEQYVLENNQIVYNFHKNWMLNIFKQTDNNFNLANKTSPLTYNLSAQP